VKELDFIVGWLAATLRIATPLVFTGIGGIVNERAGVLNIGKEGMMLVGAFTAYTTAAFTGNLFYATVFAMFTGGLFGLVHAYLTISRKANQIVSGAAINILAIGLMTVLLRQVFPSGRERVPLFSSLFPEVWHELPILGPILFAQPWIVYFIFILPPLATWLIFKTTWGLNLRAVGEYPQAVEAAGLSAIRLRYIAVFIGGAMAGLGGAALVLATIGHFTHAITGGRGFVVLAAVIFGRWHPVWVALACLLFGGADALQLRIQTLYPQIPHQFLVMLPYILTIGALVGVVGKTKQPAGLMIPYDPKDN